MNQQQLNIGSKHRAKYQALFMECALEALWDDCEILLF